LSPTLNIEVDLSRIIAWKIDFGGNEKMLDNFNSML
jgi:hypothetical protein